MSGTFDVLQIQEKKAHGQQKWEDVLAEKTSCEEEIYVARKLTWKKRQGGIISRGNDTNLGRQKGRII